MRKLAAAYRQELTLETQSLYIAELSDLRQDRLELAFRHALRECKFFPTIAEIRDFEEKVQVDPARIEAAHQRLRERLAAQPPVPMLKSVVDEAPKPKREFKPLSPEESERRLKELIKQAQHLQDSK
jgi:hypothetical protein